MSSEQSKTLVFLAYGAGSHVDETLYALLTLRRFSPGEFDGLTVRVVTDQVAIFEPAGFEIVPIATETFEEWKGPARYHHRCKILTLKYILERFGGRAILVDGDTYFLRPPGPLFDRIGPGRSLMHRIEGALADSRHAFNHRLAEILEDRSPGYCPLIELARGGATVQWNSGVVGLRLDQVGMLDEALELMDYLRARTFAPVLEQLAFTIILTGRTKVTSSRDTIFHYCTSPERDAFRAALPGLLAESAGMPPADRARWLYARRIRPSLALSARNRLKDVLNVTGLYPARDRAECC